MFVAGKHIVQRVHMLTSRALSAMSWGMFVIWIDLSLMIEGACHFGLPSMWWLSILLQTVLRILL